MRIDWFTLIAQVANFLVLVWLLHRFLYGRIVEAMDQREAKIASRLKEAAQKRAEAEQEADQYRVKNRELEEQRECLLAQAKEDAESRRRQLIDEARVEAERVQVQWFETLQHEQKTVLQEFRERAGQQVFAIARRALKDVANAELEQQVLTVFLDRLQKLDSAEREAIIAAVRDSDREVEIRSAFPIASKVRESVSRSLREQLDDRVDVRFATSPELTCGIELRAHSHRLVWNLDSYLEGLEESFFEVLDERAGENAKP